MTVLIVDYGMGNIASARRAIEECGGRALVSDDPADIKVADRSSFPASAPFRTRWDGCARVDGSMPCDQPFTTTGCRCSEYALVCSCSPTKAMKWQRRKAWD